MKSIFHRYPYYMLRVYDVEISFLTWLRYTIWIPLYPLGFICEGVVVLRWVQFTCIVRMHLLLHTCILHKTLESSMFSVSYLLVWDKRDMWYLKVRDIVKIHSYVQSHVWHGSKWIKVLTQWRVFGKFGVSTHIEVRWMSIKILFTRVKLDVCWSGGWRAVGNLHIGSVATFETSYTWMYRRAHISEFLHFILILVKINLFSMI